MPEYDEVKFIEFLSKTSDMLQRDTIYTSCCKNSGFPILLQRGDPLDYKKRQESIADNVLAFIQKNAISPSGKDVYANPNYECHTNKVFLNALEYLTLYAQKIDSPNILACAESLSQWGNFYKSTANQMNRIGTHTDKDWVLASRTIFKQQNDNLPLTSDGRILSDDDVNAIQQLLGSINRKHLEVYYATINPAHGMLKRPWQRRQAVNALAQNKKNVTEFLMDIDLHKSNCGLADGLKDIANYIEIYGDGVGDMAGIAKEALDLSSFCKTVEGLKLELGDLSHEKFLTEFSKLYYFDSVTRHEIHKTITSDAIHGATHNDFDGRPR